MVQLTEGVAGEPLEVAPPANYSQSYLSSMEQIPHTLLTHQSNSPHQSSPSTQPCLLPESCSEVLDTCSFDHPVATSADNFQSVDTAKFPDCDRVQSSPHFTFGSIVNMPSTVLSTGLGMKDGLDFESSSNSDVAKTFEIIPVTDNSSYTVTDPEQQDNSVLQKSRMDSVDSLNESKGYASDSSSDVYMNSDYTDTITSADSNTFLLPASVKTGSSIDNAETEPTVAKSDSLVVSCYSNEAYISAPKAEHVSWSSDESEQEKTDEVHIENDNSKKDHWIVRIPEEDDSGMMADKEDEEEDNGNAEDVPLQVDSTIENLVNHLAEQHPLEVVDIRVQVLDGPVYEPLTEPVEDEQSWLQSTDSLHHYKLLKQGRSSTMDNLRVHAINNLMANTMNNLHERSSFLNLTAASVSNLGNACQRALSYVRADMEFGSMMSLGDNMKRSCSMLAGKDQLPNDMEALSPKKKGEATVASGRHTRNVLYMALLVTILLISVNTTRNLQSSLNQEGGVGIICLAVMFASYMLGSLLSPVLVQGQGVKNCIIAGLVLQLLYVAANLYPVLWLMLPASLGGGASLALIWNAMSTYIVLLARGESDFKHKSYQRVSDKFFGIFCLIYQSNLIVGNLVASLVLTFGGGVESNATILPVNGSDFNSTLANLSGSYFGNSAINESFIPQELATDSLAKMNNGNWSDLNSTSLIFDASKDTHYNLCGAEYCHHFVINRDASAVPERTVYLLFGIFMFLVVAAILIAVFLLEPLSPSLFVSTSRPWHDVKRQFLSLVKFSRNAKFLLMLPLLLYSSMQFSFVCSEVMMAYVTCPVGVWLVGYTMIGYGVCCSVASYITQTLVPRTGRGFFIGLATALNAGLLVYMRVWQPHPDSVLPLFIITSLFGLTDGIWNVNANGLCGSVFPEHYEEAFTGLRMAQGLGGAFSMAYAPFICMAVKIYIMIAAAVVVFIGYIGAEVLLRRDNRQKNILFEKEVV